MGCGREEGQYQGRLMHSAGCNARRIFPGHVCGAAQMPMPMHAGLQAEAAAIPGLKAVWYGRAIIPLFIRNRIGGWRTFPVRCPCAEQAFSIGIFNDAPKRGYLSAGCSCSTLGFWQYDSRFELPRMRLGRADAQSVK